jgi:hypothetical protein
MPLKALSVKGQRVFSIYMPLTLQKTVEIIKYYQE